MSNPVDDDKGIPDNALEMSDEEFMKLDPSSFEGSATIDDTDAGDADEDGGSDEEAKADDNQSKPDESDTVDKKETTAPAAKTVDSPTKEEPAVPDTTKTPATTAELTDTQYVEIGRQIMSEFKANGTTIKIKNVDDAIQLMQMGANYHKKMSGLKPSLKTLKLLENHGLMDPEKLNFLIDLSQKKPEAITQLLKDSKIDPLNIDLQDTKEYVPQQRSISDTEILLDEVLESISHSPAYTKTLTILGDQWDVDSKAALAKTPEAIRIINAHVENGIYDQVANAVAYERSLGKLSGVNDFDAYQRVGAYMHENNLFVSAAGKPNTETPVKTPPTPEKATETVDQEEERRRRKQAASPSRNQQGPDKSKSTYNPLEMSDEEFIKFNKLSL